MPLPAIVAELMQRQCSCGKTYSIHKLTQYEIHDKKTDDTQIILVLDCG